MVRARKEPERCKSPDKNTGKRCTEAALDNNGYCGRHFEEHKQTGPKTPEGKAAIRNNPVKHGLMAEKWLFPEQRELLVEAKKERGNLFNELDWARMRLWWTQRLIYRFESGEEDGMEDAEIQVEQTGARQPTDDQGRPVAGDPVGGSLKFRRTQKKISLITLYEKADQFTRTIMNIEKQIFEQGQQVSGLMSDPVQAGLQIKASLRAMFAVTGGNGDENGDAPQPFWMRGGSNGVQLSEEEDEE